jgi:hypothetical protein
VTFFDAFCVTVQAVTARAAGDKHMSNPRTRHVTTSDGVTIGATVHGEGPPLTFVQGVGQAQFPLQVWRSLYSPV